MQFHILLANFLLAFFVDAHFFTNLVTNSTACPFLTRVERHHNFPIVYKECGARMKCGVVFRPAINFLKNGALTFYLNASCFDSTPLKIRDSIIVLPKLCETPPTNCQHFEHDGIYEGTICCANDSIGIFKSLAWKMFFSKAGDEFHNELVDTEQILTHAWLNTRLTGINMNMTAYLVLPPLAITTLFSSLYLMQFAFLAKNR
ncbi:unnamed protein product [Caenorhabditis bovis]|uniref:Uncharacterized protein n=1 Tax=Caenorhabditis bovis TaxID=2654633 RepID=A0A8S1EVA2_9PELO|nr:unnamed protein product [Caenorhabditis bovis]